MGHETRLEMIYNKNCKVWMHETWKTLRRTNGDTQWQAPKWIQDEHIGIPTVSNHFWLFSKQLNQILPALWSDSRDMICYKQDSQIFCDSVHSKANIFCLPFPVCCAANPGSRLAALGLSSANPFQVGSTKLTSMQLRLIPVCQRSEGAVSGIRNIESQEPLSINEANVSWPNDVSGCNMALGQWLSQASLLLRAILSTGGLPPNWEWIMEESSKMGSRSPKNRQACLLPLEASGNRMAIMVCH